MPGLIDPSKYTFGPLQHHTGAKSDVPNHLASECPGEPCPLARKQWQSPLQELYAKFDASGADGNQHLAYYGQLRAAGQSHDDAIQLTYVQFKSWCDKIWPVRGIKLPEDV
jgi:hypothetical protein